MSMVILKEKMTPEQFCYWLQGYVEVTDAKEAGIAPADARPTVGEWAVIRRHLQMVFGQAQPMSVTTPGMPGYQYPGGQAGNIPQGETIC